MPFEIQSLKPTFKRNYNLGYIGFTYHNNEIISQGIAYFTRWSRMGEIKVSHALIVTGENECIEAHLNSGVARRKLSDYFEDEHCQIFFRQPKNYNIDLGKNIVKEAEKQLGYQYDPRLIGELLKSYSLIGWTINKITQGKFEQCLTSDHEDDYKWICSELAAHCLDQQPEYKDQGILKKPDATIDPQELFEDEIIFASWKNS